MGTKSVSIFPYRKNTQGDLFPIIPLEITSKSANIDTSALIDSGAVLSVFRPDIAAQLGITIETGVATLLGGVAGRIKAYIHVVELHVAKKKIKCPVAFSEEYFVSFNLLGRQGFFENFTIMFEEKHKRVVLN